MHLLHFLPGETASASGTEEVVSHAGILPKSAASSRAGKPAPASAPTVKKGRGSREPDGAGPDDRAGLHPQAEGRPRRALRPDGLPARPPCPDRGQRGRARGPRHGPRPLAHRARNGRGAAPLRRAGHPAPAADPRHHGDRAGHDRAGRDAQGSRGDPAREQGRMPAGRRGTPPRRDLTEADFVRDFLERG